MSLSTQKTRVRKIMDGLVEVSPLEFESFINKVAVFKVGKNRNHTQCTIRIPYQIARKMKLRKGDVLLVAIRHATAKDVAEYMVFDK